MTKPLTVFIVLICLCFVNGVHYQKYAPSTPGGTYEGTNGTISTNGNTQTTNTLQPLINGKPYVFTGPFTLVCYYQNSSNVFRFDSCYNANDCYNLLL